MSHSEHQNVSLLLGSFIAGKETSSLKQLLHDMQMKALAKAKDWEGLETFAREKKSPIGLDPFIATAKEAGAPEGTLSRWEELIARVCPLLGLMICEGSHLRTLTGLHETLCLGLGFTLPTSRFLRCQQPECFPTSAVNSIT